MTIYIGLRQAPSGYVIRNSGFPHSNYHALSVLPLFSGLAWSSWSFFTVYKLYFGGQNSAYLPIFSVHDCKQFVVAYNWWKHRLHSGARVNITGKQLLPSLFVMYQSFQLSQFGRETHHFRTHSTVLRFNLEISRFSTMNYNLNDNQIQPGLKSTRLKKKK